MQPLASGSGICGLGAPVFTSMGFAISLVAMTD